MWRRRAEPGRLAGDWGERLVRRYLRLRGYRIVAENYRCPCGEVDLIARRGRVLCFVEVKARRGRARGSPFEAVTRVKRRRLCRAAAHYLAGRPKPPVCRFDVAAVEVEPASGRVRVRYLPAAFTEDDT
ncbi:MAG: YraN family protein [Nitrospirae bacterium]|nr:MAG: YraN family protein [Nitrospirota bacterium]